MRLLVWALLDTLGVYNHFDLKPACSLPENMPLPTAAPVKRPRVSIAKTTTPRPKDPAPCDIRSDEEDNEPPSDEVRSDSESSVESETSDTSLTAWRATQSQQQDPSSSSKQA